MKYAWIEDNKIRDICQGGNPNECYHADVAKFYNIEVPDEAKNGQFLIDGVLYDKDPNAPIEQPITLELPPTE